MKDFQQNQEILDKLEKGMKVSFSLKLSTKPRKYRMQNSNTNGSIGTNDDTMTVHSFDSTNNNNNQQSKHNDASNIFMQTSILPNLHSLAAINNDNNSNNNNYNMQQPHVRAVYIQCWSVNKPNYSTQCQ